MKSRRWTSRQRKFNQHFNRELHLKRLHKYYTGRAAKAKSPRIHREFMIKSLRSFTEYFVLANDSRRNEQKTRLLSLQAAKDEMKHSYKGQS